MDQYHHLIKRLDPRLAISMGKVGALLKVFLHPSYTAIVNGRSGPNLYLVLHMINRF